MEETLRTAFENRWAIGHDDWDPPKIADDAVTSTTLTVAGARPGDPAVASHDQIGAVDVLISAHVQAANTVRVVILNKTGGQLDIAAGVVFAAVRIRY